MKKKIFLILLLISFTLACAKKPDGAVAEIDGKIITEDEYNYEFKNYKNIYIANADEEFSKLTMSQSESQDMILRRGVLEKLIIRATVEREFLKENGILSEEVFIDKKEEIENALGGPEQYKIFLEKNGIDEEFFDSSIKENIMLDDIKNNYRLQFNPSEKELMDYFELNKDNLYRYDLSLILTEDEDSAYKIIRAHENFASLAIKHSKDAITAVNGGQVRGVSPDEFPLELAKYIRQAKEGEVADPIKTSNGYYVVRVDKAYKDYESLKDVVREQFFESEFKKHIEELRDAGNVKVYMDIK